MFSHKQQERSERKQGKGKETVRRNVHWLSTASFYNPLGKLTHRAPTALSWICPASKSHRLVLAWACFQYLLSVHRFDFFWYQIWNFFKVKNLVLSCHVILKHKPYPLLGNLALSYFLYEPQKSTSLSYSPFFSLPTSILLECQIHEFILPLAFFIPMADIVN